MRRWTRERWRRVGWGALRAVGFLIVLGVLMYAIGTWRAPSLPDTAPDFALRDLEGKTVRLSDLRGKTVVLNFWASWCAPCRLEIPSFRRLARRRSDLVVVGVAADEDPATVRAAVADMGIEYPVLLGDRATLAKYGVSTFPTTVVIRSDGSIRTAVTGMMLDPHLAWVTR